MLSWIASSCILIVIVVLLRSLLRRRLSARVQYALWALVLLRLLIPVGFGSSPLSAMNVVEQTRSAVYAAAPLPAARSAAEAATVLPDAVATVPIPAAEPAAPSLADWLVGIWLGGAALVGGLFLAVNLHFSCRLWQSSERVSDANERIFVCSAVDTPCLHGLFRPAIYLPPEVLAEPLTLRHALAHEQTHLRYGDHIWSALRVVCLALHWYNPLVWLAASLSRQDAELACDEGAIARLGESSRLAYGRTLIELSCAKRQTVLLAATTLSGSRRSLKERITRIAHRTKMRRVSVAALLFAAAIAVGVTFTDARPAPPAPQSQRQEAALTQAECRSADSAATPSVEERTEPEPTGPELLSVLRAMAVENTELFVVTEAGTFHAIAPGHPLHEEFIAILGTIQPEDIRAGLSDCVREEAYLLQVRQNGSVYSFYRIVDEPEWFAVCGPGEAWRIESELANTYLRAVTTYYASADVLWQEALEHWTDDLAPKEEGQ